MTQQEYGTDVPATNGLATASMVLGVIGLILSVVGIGVLLLIPALILGIMGMSRANQLNGAGKGSAVAGTVMGAIGLAMSLVMLVLAGMLLPVLSKAREKARRVNCAGNLKQIGLACLMYSGDNDGAYPPDLQTLMDQDIMPMGRVYQCPSADDMEGVDFVYIGAGAYDDADNATSLILAYDSPDNHPGNQWMNFLFADGHVEGVNASSLEDACAQRGWETQYKSQSRGIGY